MASSLLLGGFPPGGRDRPQPVSHICNVGKTIGMQQDPKSAADGDAQWQAGWLKDLIARRHKAC